MLLMLCLAQFDEGASLLLGKFGTCLVIGRAMVVQPMVTGSNPVTQPNFQWRLYG